MCPYGLGQIIGSRDHIDGIECEDRGRRVAPITEKSVRGLRETSGGASTRERVAHGDELLGMRDRQHLQDDFVDQAEDRSVGADPES